MKGRYISEDYIRLRLYRCMDSRTFLSLRALACKKRFVKLPLGRETWTWAAYLSIIFLYFVSVIPAVLGSETSTSTYNSSQPLSHTPHFPALSIQTLITGDAMEGPLTVSAHLSTEVLCCSGCKEMLKVWVLRLWNQHCVKGHICKHQACLPWV